MKKTFDPPSSKGKFITLEIQLTEQPRLARLKIEGLNKNDTKDVEEKIKPVLFLHQN